MKNDNQFLFYQAGEREVSRERDFQAVNDGRVLKIQSEGAGSFRKRRYKCHQYLRETSLKRES